MEDAISYLRCAEAESPITEPMGDPPTVSRDHTETGKMEIGEQKVPTTDRDVNSFFKTFQGNHFHSEGRLHIEFRARMTSDFLML